MEPTTPKRPLTSAMEDYLEAIYHLEQERRIARVRDIAKRVGVKMSSVSSALRTLAGRGLVRYDRYQYITLTDEGAAAAKEIVRKHEALKRFLVRILDIEETIAEDNACRIEHHLDPQVIDRLIRYVEFTDMCPVDQTRWRTGATQTCENCTPCLDQAKEKMVHREEAQREALKGNMTLAEVAKGAQVVIDHVSANEELEKSFPQDTLQNGVIIEVEDVDSTAGGISVTVKGYHVKLTREEAAHIFVKPI